MLESVDFILCCWSDRRAIQEWDECESRTMDIMEFRMNSWQVERVPMLVLEFFDQSCLVSVRCGRECQLNQCSLNKESCAECVETHEWFLLTGSFFAELANQFDLSCNSFCAHLFVIRKS